MQPTVEILEGKLTPEEVTYLHDMVKNFSGFDPKPGFEGTGVITEHSLEDENAYPTGVDPERLTVKVVEIVRDYFLSKYEMMGELKFNRVFGVTMHEGSELPAHRDEDANNDGIFDGKKRSHVCSLLLNDDYEGGELVFPDLDKKLKVPAGSMVVFPGYYLAHGVEKITKGTRRVLLVFFYDVLPQ